MIQLLKSKKGFTLIEILIVLAILALLFAVVIVALNPARNFMQARDTTRWSHANALLNAVWQNKAENQGIWDGAACGGDLPATPQIISNYDEDANAGTDEYDICDCVVPDFLAVIPVDPSTGAWGGDCVSNYTTDYQISEVAGRVTISAEGEMDAAAWDISVTR